MKRLLCRWIEYFLALHEDDIGDGMPGWVHRHLQACAHCQKEVQTYRRAREAVRQYARWLPDTPPAGWRPLQVGREAKQRTFPLQTVSPSLALRRISVPVAAAVVAALLGLAVWQRVSPLAGGRETPPQTAQNVTPPRQDVAEHVSLSDGEGPDKKPAAPVPSPRDSKTKHVIPSTSEEPKPSKQPAVPKQDKPVPAPRHAPPLHHPPRRIVVAVQPKRVFLSGSERSGTAPATDTEPVPEPVVPVQPVVVEARPVTPTPVPEGYIIEAAYPATAGAVE